MTPRTSWLRVIAEGLVIVASILLALATDAWWDRLQDRAEEQDILTGLETDFVANQLELETVIKTHRDFHALLVHLEGAAPQELAALSDDSVKTYVRALSSGRSFDAFEATLQGVIASGRLSLIRDARLRAILVAWQNGVADTSEELGELRSATDRVLQRMAALGGPWEGPVLEPELAAAMSSYPPADLTVVATDAELMNLARDKRFRATLYLFALLPLRERADSVLTMIRAGRS